MSNELEPTTEAVTTVEILMEAAKRLPKGVTVSLSLGATGNACPVCDDGSKCSSRVMLRRHLLEHHGLPSKFVGDLLRCAPRRSAAAPAVPAAPAAAQARLEYEWARGEHRGWAADTIFYVLAANRGAAASVTEHEVPTTADSFARCHWLLTRFFPAWRPRLLEVAKKYPEWAPFVREWDRLAALYESERPTGRAPKLFAALRRLNDEADATLAAPEPKGLLPGGKRWPAPPMIVPPASAASFPN